MLLSKETNKAPITDLKDMEMYKLSKIQNNLLRKFSELQENRHITKQN